jgi:hypothetical protein
MGTEGRHKHASLPVNLKRSSCGSKNIGRCSMYGCLCQLCGQATAAGVGMQAIVTSLQVTGSIPVLPQVAFKTNHPARCLHLGCIEVVWARRTPGKEAVRRRPHAAGPEPKLLLHRGVQEMVQTQHVVERRRACPTASTKSGNSTADALIHSHGRSSAPGAQRQVLLLPPLLLVACLTRKKAAVATAALNKCCTHRSLVARHQGTTACKGCGPTVAPAPPPSCS